MRIKPVALVNVILATTLLTSLFFLGLNSSFTQPPELTQYDAWHDVNDDGIIDLEDIFQLILKYETAGDPTKNVTVCNWPDWMGCNRLIATNYLTAVLRVTSEAAGPLEEGVWGASSEMIGIGSRNVTFTNAQLSGGLAWSYFGGRDPPMAGEISGVGRVEVYNATGHLITEFAIPIQTLVTVSNVDKIIVYAEAYNPKIDGASYSYAAYVVASVYWIESP